ncbi:MAG: carbonic anhydrase family protein [Magnetococcales bacterium]|nr:carbonic anhydrase family protein [Magnetococcales bacterium]
MKVVRLLAACAVLGLGSSAYASGSGAHWSYEGSAGPDKWASLGYPHCKGSNQSPIDIKHASMTEMDDISFSYKSTSLNAVNNGHTVQFNYDSGSTITVAGKSYSLLQFHFHSLSEHTVGGLHSSMEMHLVHKASDGTLGVVGVFLQPKTDAGHGNGHGSDSDPWETVFGALPGASGLKLSGSQSFNANDLLPHTRSYYHYSGSLTTPPCSEGVNWFVLQEPVRIDAKKLARFQSIFDSNYRPVQPLNSRHLYEKDSNGTQAGNSGGHH